MKYKILVIFGVLIIYIAIFPFILLTTSLLLNLIELLGIKVFYTGFVKFTPENLTFDLSIIYFFTLYLRTLSYVLIKKDYENEKNNDFFVGTCRTSCCGCNYGIRYIRCIQQRKNSTYQLQPISRRI